MKKNFLGAVNSIYESRREEERNKPMTMGALLQQNQTKISGPKILSHLDNLSQINSVDCH